MGKLLSRTALLAGIAVAAVLIFAQRRSAETGKDVTDVLTNLPAELKQSQAIWRQRLREAIETGKKAAAEREAEIEGGMAKTEGETIPAPDFIV